MRCCGGAGRSYGFIGVLKKPVNRDDYDDIYDKLYDSDSNLSLNGEGTLLILDYNSNASYNDRYSLTIGSSSQDPADLLHEASQHGFEVDEDSIQPFNCIWYDGTDSPLWSLTKEEFLKFT